MKLTRSSVALTALVALIATVSLSSGASANPVRTFPLNDGMNTAKFKVPHQTKSLPPAIVFSTRPANLKCAAVDYEYGARETRGHLKIKVRCQNTPRKASANLVFRAPYVRKFALRNGTSRIRIRADKPLGNTRPLGSLTTVPRDTACDVAPTGSKIRPRTFSATATMTCKDLPAGATGLFGLGGLLTDGELGKARHSPVTTSYQGASTRALGDFVKIFTAGDYRPNKCDDPTEVTVKGKLVIRSKTCFSAPFTLGPWEGQWVGFGNPSAQCESGWKRNINAMEFPAAWLLSNSSVTMWTDPWSAAAWSWSWGLVSNWQFSGYIEFRLKWNCYQT
jgi:hypothetical protein